MSPRPTGATGARPPEGVGRGSALDLQRRVGNAAVVTLLQPAGTRATAQVRRRLLPRRFVQRDVLGPADDPQGYTKPGGKKITGTGTIRIEVTGLIDDKTGVKYGVTGGFADKGSNEKQMTKESPDNTAVVIMPETVSDKLPTQVILHFHGWGFRPGDPYPGYAVSTGGPSAKQGAHGTVRDVDQEHWEQQIGAVSRERAKLAKEAGTAGGTQIVAVLAQGRGKSEFGNVPTFDYIKNVFSKVPALTPITTYNIILSAHSGGGNQQVAPKVNAGDAPGRDRTKLPAPVAGKAAKQASDLVVLFDAEGMASTMSWIEGEIKKLVAATKAPASDAAAQAAIDVAPRFRGYFATSGFYWDDFHDAAVRLENALKTVPEKWRGTTGVVSVRDLFRFIEVKGKGVNHEHVISGATDKPAEQGSLADALRASLDPTVDRAKAYDPKEGAPRLAVFLKKLEEQKAKAKAAKEAADAAKAKAAAEKAAKQKTPAVQPSLVPGAVPVVQRDGPEVNPPRRRRLLQCRSRPGRRATRRRSSR